MIHMHDMNANVHFFYTFGWYRYRRSLYVINLSKVSFQAQKHPPIRQENILNHT
ncbi:hypothetical protein Hanom_Chr05g00435601 [Helianthus anomalus]